ncbi:MAG TPA: MBL fold metallo-hydrolase [Lacunisphaera sp.]|nr:MBL fold metallo-hydrolase [Lacunisphaera sp.]
MNSFPVSDHCDGERFFNPHGPLPRSFSDLPKWWWQQRRGSAKPWPAAVPACPPVVLPAAIPERQLTATFIGHATYLLQFAGLTVLTDPVFASRAGPFGLLGPRRVQPPALRLGELPRVDVVLLSHNHYDHLDVPSLRWLVQHRRPLIVAPLGLGAWLAGRGVPGVVELDWWQGHFTATGEEIVCTPAQHWSSRWPWDRCRTLWGGFMLRTRQGLVWFAGDSGWGRHFAEVRTRIGAPDCALLPIGAYEPRWFMAAVHMNPDEAIRAHLAVGARTSLAMHHATFRLTDEAYDAPAADLAAARQAHGISADAFLVPAVGASVSLRLPGGG